MIGEQQAGASAASLVSAAQIAAQLDAVLDRDPHATAIAIRAASQGAWPQTMERRGRRFRVRWCESRLALREALTDIDGIATEAGGVVLMTPLADTAVPDDVAARLARGRLFQPKGWDILRQLFAATETDARLARHDWMPELLIEAAEACPVNPVPGGFLDLDTAWREVLVRCLGLDSARPDPATLMRWALRADASVLLDKMPPKARDDTLRWLASQAGPAGKLVMRCIETGRGADAASLGIICELLFAPRASGVAALGHATVRLERHVGNQHVAMQEGREWGSHATRLLEHSTPGEVRAIVDRADALLADLLVGEHAHRSDWLPRGLEQRMSAFAGSLLAHAQQPVETRAQAVEAAADAVLSHRLVGWQPLRAERVRMAQRLARWLVRPAPAGGSLAQQVAAQADDAAFADWARFKLLGGDELPDVSSAYAELRAAVSQRREAANLAFAAALAANLKQNVAVGERVVPVERALESVVAPLAASHPVLLLVIDGMSLAVFRELFERPEDQGWIELVPEASDRPLLGLAALPTITEVSRASLLCGQIAPGVAANEKQGFALHPALLPCSSSSNPPKLFHKGELSTEGNLSAEVRAALASPAQKVVGVVYNAVDDHLDGPEQLQLRWTLEELRLLPPVLREARDSRRVVVVTADHGHVLEDGSAPLEGGPSPRWRNGTQAAVKAEVALRGERVRTPDGADHVVCLWSERSRYGGRHNGYHGGAAPAEVVVPLSVFAPAGIKVSGWRDAPPQQPDWWELPAVKAAPAPMPAPVPPAPTRRSQPSRAGQGGLFGDEELPVPPAPTGQPVDWIAAVLASALYDEQRRLAARVALPDEQMRRLIAALDERGGKLTRGALAQRLGLAEMRLGGVVSVARRMLNADQAPVLTVDEAAGTIELNRALLLKQFGVASGGAR